MEAIYRSAGEGGRELGLWGSAEDRQMYYLYTKKGRIVAV